LPGWDPSHVEYPVRANPLVEAVYLRGETVSAPFINFVEGSVPPIVWAGATRVLGLQEGLLCPLKAGDSVWGAMGFFGSRVPTEQERLVCEAFAREASLTVENAHLLE